MNKSIQKLNDNKYAVVHSTFDLERLNVLVEGELILLRVIDVGKFIKDNL
jgi:hypothetical protein